MIVLYALVPILIGYLIGSIPFGHIVGKLHGKDLTKEGSGSTGATNVLRLIGKKAAFFVLLCDFGKGFLAPIIAAYVATHFALYLGLQDIDHYLVNCIESNVNAWAMFFGGFFCIIGHVRSIWIGFRGGKAVASGVGILFAMNWIVGSIVVAIWLTVVGISRYSSLGALVAIPASPFLMIIFTCMTFSRADGECAINNCIVFVTYCIIAASYIVAKHIPNIKRLLKGTEPKIGNK